VQHLPGGGFNVLIGSRDGLGQRSENLFFRREDILFTHQGEDVGAFQERQYFLADTAQHYFFAVGQGPLDKVFNYLQGGNIHVINMLEPDDDHHGPGGIEVVQLFQVCGRGKIKVALQLNGCHCGVTAAWALNKTASLGTRRLQQGNTCGSGVSEEQQQ